MTIALNELIDQVREDLLSPRRASTSEAMYPFLFVEEIELEVSITVSSAVEGRGTVNIQVVELGSGIEKGNEEMHRVKIKMTPLLTKDEVRETLKKDSRLWGKIESVALNATTKDGGMVGQE